MSKLREGYMQDLERLYGGRTGSLSEGATIKTLLTEIRRLQAKLAKRKKKEAAA